LLFAFCLLLFAGLCGAFLAAPPPPRLSVRTYYDFARRELRVNRSLAADPGPSTLTPNNLDQVSTSIFDPVNNAIRVYALLSPGGTHTPNNGDQVFTSIFNATNNAIQVSCVFGCGGTPVNVATDSQGWASIGSCTIGLTNASNTATASSANCFTSANVGAILQYNSGTAPNFRAVIIGVSGTTLTLSTYYPGATASGIAYASGLTSGAYNFVADACGQINASILNHPGLAIDAGGLTGQPNCTVSPWNGLAYANATTGGVLRLGATWYTVARQWFIPGGWDVGGFGKYAASATSAINTALLADTSNYIPAVYEANAVVSTNVVTTQGTSTFADHPSSGNSTLMQAIASTSCIGSTNFGIITLNSALTGFYDSSQIHIQGVTGNTGWNGTWMLTAVSGLSGTVQFNSTCPTTGTLSGAAVDLLNGDQLQGSYVVSTTGTISTSGSGP
jgi:hypothetical protein